MKRQNIDKELKALIAKILKVSPKLITDEASPETLPSWDSFNVILILDTIEKKFGIEIPMDKFMTLQTYKDLRTYLEKKA